MQENESTKTKERRYEIGGKIFFLRPLVLGQWKQLIKAVSGTKITVTNDIFVLLEELGDKVPELLAIVLTEEGISLKDKDLAEMTTFLEFAAEPELTITIVDDFFLVTQIFSLLNTISERVTARVAEINTTASMSSSFFSPGETSLNASGSPGISA